ncbi:hypothetical protein PVNG_02152, partial [Plasmodium vivax North Korean]
YPFLNNIWITYKNFDTTVREDIISYDSTCHFIIKRANTDLHIHKDFCMKLMRNLSFHSPNSPYFKPKYERCNILYNWIYNSIKENKVTENVIKECFDEYEEVMSKIRNYNICSKHTYEKIFE